MRRMHCMIRTYAKEVNHTHRVTRYYRDPLNDDFALNGIEPKPLPENFKYVRRNPFYKIGEFFTKHIFYFGHNSPQISLYLLFLTT